MLRVPTEGDGHDEVVDDAAAGDEGQQPLQHLGGAAAALEEGQHGEEHGEGEAVDGHAVARRLLQDAGGAALEGERVERVEG